jgi:hypothetical protein
MNRYGKLVAMELHRFWKIYAGLCLITFVSQASGLLISIQNYVSQAHRTMALNPEIYPHEADYANRFGRFAFSAAFEHTLLLTYGPIALCVAGIVLYVFLIWYRDWSGKNTFAYRLLMLPTSRMNLFWSKWTAIAAFVLGLIALQLLLLPAYEAIYRLAMPAGLRPAATESVLAFVRHHNGFNTLIPPTFAEFVLYYGTGLTAVAALFNVILLERSYRWKGLIAGVAYAALAAAVMIAPVAIDSNNLNGPGPLTALWLKIGAAAVVLGISLATGALLLNRKITV